MNAGWLETHPRAIRMASIACVITGAILFIKIVQLDGKIAALITEQSDNARAASEALGG